MGPDSRVLLPEARLVEGALFMKFEDLKGGLTVDEALEACRDGFLRGRLPLFVTGGHFAALPFPAGSRMRKQPL